MEIAYAAVTQSGTFMLDERGVCRWAVAGRNADGSNGAVPDRIVGGQFVATLDLESEQGLVALPQVGAPMLFAVVDASGHISLVRTTKLLRWEDKRGDDLEPADATTPGPKSSARALPVPLTRPPSFNTGLPRPPPSSPSRRHTPLPPPPARAHSDVAPKIAYPRPSVRNNFAPPRAPLKSGAAARRA